MVLARDARPLHDLLAAHAHLVQEVRAAHSLDVAMSHVRVTQLCVL